MKIKQFVKLLKKSPYTVYFFLAILVFNIYVVFLLEKALSIDPSLFTRAAVVTGYLALVAWDIGVFSAHILIKK